MADSALRPRPEISRLRGVHALWRGRQPFLEMTRQNQELASQVAQGRPPEVWFFEPDQPIFTLGRRAMTPAGQAELEPSLAHCHDRAIAVAPVDRGGLGTFHAPGQIVAFIAVPCPRLHARELCAELLKGIADLAQSRGLQAHRDLDEQVGVWTADGKLASLGLRVEAEVALHGVALNVAVDRGLCQGLALCGNNLTTLANLLTHTALTPELLHETARDLAASWGLHWPHAAK